MPEWLNGSVLKLDCPHSVGVPANLKRALSVADSPRIGRRLADGCSHNITSQPLAARPEPGVRERWGTSCFDRLYEFIREVTDRGPECQLELSHTLTCARRPWHPIHRKAGVVPRVEGYPTHPHTTEHAEWY